MLSWPSYCASGSLFVLLSDVIGNYQHWQVESWLKATRFSLACHTAMHLVSQRRQHYLYYSFCPEWTNIFCEISAPDLSCDCAVVNVNVLDWVTIRSSRERACKKKKKKMKERKQPSVMCGTHRDKCADNRARHLMIMTLHCSQAFFLWAAKLGPYPKAAVLCCVCLWRGTFMRRHAAVWI